MLFFYSLGVLFAATLFAVDVAVGDVQPGNDKWLEPARSKLTDVMGAMPFFPHRATTTGNLVLNVKDFDDA